MQNFPSCAGSNTEHSKNRKPYWNTINSEYSIPANILPCEGKSLIHEKISQNKLGVMQIRSNLIVNKSTSIYFDDSTENFKELEVKKVRIDFIRMPALQRKTFGTSVATFWGTNVSKKRKIFFCSSVTREIINLSPVVENEYLGKQTNAEK